MGITQFIVNRKMVAYFMAVLFLVGGVFSFTKLGQLEDPDFTVKTCMVVTQYPGASAAEVELEVTDRIEKAIQELPQLDALISWSRPGLSLIRVEIKQDYWSDRLSQVWDEMRKKIRDVTPELPPGAGKPDVSDDFNFVYGFVLAVTGDGFDYRQVEDFAKGIRKEFSVVPGVSRVDLWGTQRRVVYLDIDQTQLSELGMTAEAFAQTLRVQNAVVDAGNIDVQNNRLRIEVAGTFTSPEEIADLQVRPRLVDTVQALMHPGDALELPSASRLADRAGQTIRVRDVATVRSGYLEPPQTLMRFNGRPSIAVTVANVAGGNVPETGRRLDARIAEILPELPIGIELHKVAWQSNYVSSAVNGFLVSLAQAVVIVLIVLIVPSGLRMGLIIGSMLVLIIVATFIVMGLNAIPLHRMSLGALIVALGMMVDNSTFVADAMSSEISRGADRVKAAISCASSRAMPLLGATVIAIMAFYPIYASTADAGEYCQALFTVIAAALLLSWFISMTLTPVMCLDLLPGPKPGAKQKDPSDSVMARGLTRLATAAIRYRWVTLIAHVVVLLAVLSFSGNVRQMFFPDSSRNQLMVDYWAPAGTRVQDVSAGLRLIEEKLMADERVDSVATFVGAGPPRFYLPVDPESPNSSYGEIVVTAPGYDEIKAIGRELEPWLKENVPVLTRVRAYGVGPSDTWKFETRISGPVEADLATLRRLGEEAKRILQDEPLAREVRSEMRDPVQMLVARFNQERGRWATVDRVDLADATKRAYDGLNIGLYREGDELIPIVLRHSERERRELADNLDSLQVKPAMQSSTIPLAQVTDGVTVEWEDPVIHRWQRRRAETVQCSPIAGVTFPELRAAVIDEFEALDLPPGYEIFWDGEDDSTKDGMLSLIPGLIPTTVVIATIVMLLYNSFRVLICILLVIPFVAIGIVPGLALSGSPMGFVAILGVLSLTGMMIKNMIVMTDSITGGIRGGAEPFDACIRAVVTQSKPILLAAATTVLGVLPLLPDVFWNSMAIAIMCGLGIGVGFTVILYPTLYATVHGIKAPARSS